MPRTSIEWIACAALAIATAAGCHGSGVEGAGSAARIAFVDMQRAAVETAEGSQARARLMRKYRADQTQLNERQRALSREKDAIDRQSNGLSPLALEARSRTLAAQLTELQALYARLQKDLQDEEQRETAGLMQKLQEVVTELGRQRGLSAVVDKANAVFVADGLDLTDEAIRDYDRRHPVAPVLRGSADALPDAG